MRTRRLVTRAQPDALRWSSGILLGLTIFVSLRPVSALAHEALVLAVATALAQVAASPALQAALRALPSDPIYTGAVLALVGDIQGAGIAIAGPFGDALHLVWPSTFLPADLVSEGAWTSALILPGSTVAARSLSFFAADVMVLATGWAFWRWATNHHLTSTRVAVALAGAALMAHVVVEHVIDSSISLGDFEALGLPFAFSALFGGSPHDRPRVTSLLLQIPDQLRPAILGALLAMVALAVAIAGVEGARRLAGLTVWRQSSDLRSIRARTAPASVHRYALLSAAVALGLSPIGHLADANTRVLSVNAEVRDAGELQATQIEAPSPSPPEPPLSGPDRVTFSGGNFQYRYLVDGEPVRIKGMGYNVRYAHLPIPERIALYDRDFALMRDAGVNTVFGWETGEFDRVTLDRAWAAGLGVAPPFDLRPELDYTDPDVRSALRAEVLRWVVDYRDHPAVRMWAVGNEVLHKLVFPSWMPLQAEEWREARAQAFATFLVQLVDEIHTLDPNHPIIHRDAEEAYVRHVREALVRDGINRPWFAYGVNAYTPRLAALLERWPESGMDVPLLVSEFSPGGLGAQDRPAGLHEMWDIVEAAGDRVIGGAVYAWSVEGPEEVDRVFGLVDADGKPVDGALRAVAAMYGGDAPREEELASGPAAAPPLDESGRVREHLRLALAEAQETGTWPEGFAGPSRAIARVLDTIGSHAVSGNDLQAARLSNSTRDDGDDPSAPSASWWVTWSPPNQPDARVAFIVRGNGEHGLTVTFACRASA